MALVLKDRVKETTSTAGTGSITLAGPVQGYQGFSVIGNGNTTYYTIAGTSEWEVGIGTYSGGVLSRDTVLGSSANGSKVAFSAGVKDVFVTYPADKAISTDTLPVTGATNTASPNATVNVASLTAVTSSANGDLALVAKGTGALLGQVPTGTTAGGNKRGIYAVDWQQARFLANEVASGAYSGVLSGEDNKASGTGAFVGGGYSNYATDVYTTIAGGGFNAASNDFGAVVGGYNNIASGLYSIAGGGQSNLASGAESFVGGGKLNTASATNSVASGGLSNTASGQYATVSGGRQNTAASNYSSISGGQSNSATGLHTMVAGGQSNTASSANAAVLGGGSNTASGLYASVSGGSQNLASSTAATVVGGTSNTASSLYSAVVGGSNNLASGGLSGVIGGEYGTTRGITGYLVIPASQSPIQAKAGVQQSGCLIVGCQTTDATTTKLRSDSNAADATNQLILQNNSAVLLNIDLVGWDQTDYQTINLINGLIVRGANAASTVLKSPGYQNYERSIGANTWGLMALSADTTNGGLILTVSGQAGKTIRWVARIFTTEVAF